MSTPSISSPGHVGDKEGSHVGNTEGSHTGDKEGSHTGEGEVQFPTAEFLKTNPASNKFKLKAILINKRRIQEICKAAAILFGTAIVNSVVVLALKHRPEGDVNKFSANYFLTWLCTSTFAFPIMIILFRHRNSNRRNFQHGNFNDQFHRSTLDCWRYFREALEIDENLSVKNLVAAIVPATIVIQIGIYAALRGIPFIEISETMALLLAHRSFVLFAGWLIFHWPVSPIRVSSAAVSMMGIVMITHGKGLYSIAFRGVSCGTVAASLIGISELICCYSLGRTTQKQWTIMIGFYGICSLICAWPLLLIFGISGIENFADAAEFWYICIGFSFAILGNVSLQIWGNLITFPFIPKFSLLLSCAVTAVMDQLLFDVGLPVLQLLGYLFLLFGYTLLLFHDKIAENLAEEFDIDDITTV